MHVSQLDAAVPFESSDGSTIRELAGRVSLPSRRQSLAEATIPPGGATDEHYHPVAEEVYFFQAGRGRVKLGDEQHDVQPGACVLIPPGVVHKLFNTGEEPLRLLCSCAPPWSAQDTILTGA